MCVRGMSMEVGGGSRPIGPLTPAMVCMSTCVHDSAGKCGEEAT